MHLSRIVIENFRIFGSSSSESHADIALKPGLNLLVGENDSGKSAVVDALRHTLLTTSRDYNPLSEEDFHIAAGQRASSLQITCTFSDLDTPTVGRFIEYTSVDESGKPVLHVTLKASRVEAALPSGASKYRFPYTITSGKRGDGPRIEGEVREFLRATYLKPLRDAEAQLASGRGSRLSQILENHPKFAAQSVDDYDPEKKEVHPKTLVGIFRRAEDEVIQNPVISDAREELNTKYLQELSLGSDRLAAGIGVSRGTELKQILEKLELWLEPVSEGGDRTRWGLGMNNILFMAAELLLLGESASEALPLLLIEEPEAHLHPQMQLRLMSLLEDKAQDGSATQIILTTHSPNLASKAKLQRMQLLHKGRAFALDPVNTRLDPSDYRFLERFLDVTKANLFFAKGVIMVEGDSEALLLPTLAELLGASLSASGVSIVRVGTVGFFRYSRILQRADEKVLPIPVACVADRDIIPDAASIYVPKKKNKKKEELPTYTSDFDANELAEKVKHKKRHDGGCVQTFVSENWTLEYDLALAGLEVELHAAISISKTSRDTDVGPRDEKYASALKKAQGTIQRWTEEGKSAEERAALIYEDLYKGRASKPETAQLLSEILLMKGYAPGELRNRVPAYIINAIAHATSQPSSQECHAAEPHDH